jgi:hypothetical protein
MGLALAPSGHKRMLLDVHPPVPKGHRLSGEVAQFGVKTLSKGIPAAGHLDYGRPSPGQFRLGPLARRYFGLLRLAHRLVTGVISPAYQWVWIESVQISAVPVAAFSYI